MTHALPVPPAGSKGARTRERILASALDLFAESGFNSVSLRAIAARAGVTHVAVLRYFDDRDHLLLEALALRDRLRVSWTFDEDGSVSAQVGTPEGARRLLAVSVLAMQADARDRTIVSLFTKLAAEATDPAHPAHRYFRARYQRLAALYTRGFAVLLPERPGARRPHPDPALVAGQLIAVMDGTQLQWLLRDTDADPDALARPVREFLRGLGLEPAAALVAAEARRQAPAPTDDDPVDRADPVP